MSTPTNADRVKAARIRKRRADGKLLVDADRVWLADYERKQTRPLKRNTPPTGAERGRNTEGGQQLAIAGSSAPTGGLVQTTAPPVGVVDPTAHVWTPTVPAPSAGAEPPPPGAPPAPEVGSPVLDGSASAPPQGDPAAAKQFATLVGFFVSLGIGAGRDMLDELGAVPEQLRALLLSDEAASGLLATVQASAERVALKYGFTGVPLGDEAIVLGALVGSGVLVAKQAKRKRVASTPKPEVTEPRDDGPKPPPSDIDGLWGTR